MDCPPPERDVSRDTLVVTQGENIKLALVEVALFSESIIQPYIESEIKTTTTEIIPLIIRDQQWSKELLQRLSSSDRSYDWMLVRYPGRSRRHGRCYPDKMAHLGSGLGTVDTQPEPLA